MSDVRLQLLCRRPLDADGVRKVESVLAKMGAQVTGRGAMTFSARIGRELFKKVFSATPAQAARPANPADDLAVPVPTELGDLVESITQAPTHLPMKD